MKMEIKSVSYDNKDLTTLVAELDEFFVEEWGSELEASYKSHHTLSNMAERIVIFVDGEPAGCGCWKLLETRQAEIKRMFVRPEYRRLGLANKILSHLEESIVKNGHHTAVLETGKEMKSAIQFYERQGYHLVPNFGDFIGDDVCVCMEKQI